MRNHSAHGPLFSHLSNIFDGAVEVMQPGGDNEGGATESRGSSSGVHPVALHAVHETQRRRRHVVHFVSEVQQLGESG